MAGQGWKPLTQTQQYNTMLSNKGKDLKRGTN